MAEKEDSGPQLTGLIGPGLIVALASLVAYFSLEPRLQSQRPDLSKRLGVPAPPSPPGLAALHARLWDDPLAVAYEHSETHDGAAGRRAASLKDLLRNVAPVESAEPDVRKYFKAVVENVRKSPGPGNRRFLFLGVLVPGEPYDSHSEERKRITYAVVAALGNAGYELSYPDRLSYVSLPVWIDVRAVNRAVSRKLVVPVKLFRPNRVRPEGTDPTPQFAGVQVGWINEDQLGDRPQAVIGQILEGMYGAIEDKGQIDVRLLGPASSDTLLQMADENAKWAEDSWKSSDPPSEDAYFEVTKTGYFTRWNEATLFSGRATISLEELTGGAGRKVTRSAINAVTAFVASETPGSGLTVKRTIGDDSQLAALVAAELQLRGASTPHDGVTTGGGEDGRLIVLVTERDSSYGSLFKATLENSLAKQIASRGGAARRPPVLREITYLRGLDGKIPGEKSDSDEGPSGKSRAEEPQIDPLRAPDSESIPASGRSQFDYLRRLEQQLVNLDRQGRERKEGGIVAIGVIGSDIYDKLLILRALRKHFPRTWFFSTDVDAELSQPAEYPTTRNLLVASHFGLVLHPALQRTAPPFRNSYQTSTYFSSLLAIEDEGAVSAVGKENQADPWGLQATNARTAALRPLIFEIGRSGPYQLTIPVGDARAGAPDADSASARVHPLGPRTVPWISQNWRRLLAAIFLFGLGWYFVHTPRRRAPHEQAARGARRVITLVVMAALLGLFVWVVRLAVHDHTRPDGEPLIFFEGISIWPAIFLRLAAAILSVLLVARAMRLLSARLDDILKFIASSAAGEADKKYEKPAGLLGGIRAEWMMLKSRLSRTARPAADLEDERRFYQRLERTGLRRLVVSMLQAVPFLLFVLVLFQLTEPPASPFRGPVTESWANPVQQVSTFLFLVLTFFVISGLKLGRLFVERVGDGATKWNATAIEHLQMHRGALSAADVTELLTIDRIAELTETVGRLVKYPFVILVLIIVSRHPAFDKLDLSWSLVALWLLVAAALLSSAYHLRTNAATARDKALERLNASLSHALAKSSDARADQIRQFISEIEQEQRGAFGPWTKDPLMHALALGGSGGLLLVQQVLPYF
jgi:hypothetical protein